MGQLGTKIAEDIKERFRSSDFAKQVGEDAGKVHFRSIKDQTEKGVNPSGSQYKTLSQKSSKFYGGLSYANWKGKNTGTSKANLHLGKKPAEDDRTSATSKKSAFDNFRYMAGGNRIKYDFGGYGEGERYMGEHTYGSPDINLPQRRFFPETQGAGDDATGASDEGSSVQKRNAAKVEEIVEKYINKDRTIHVKAIIS